MKYVITAALTWLLWTIVASATGIPEIVYFIGCFVIGLTYDTVGSWVLNTINKWATS